MISNVKQPESGTFAEYLVAQACFAIKIPQNMRDTEACTIGSGLVPVVRKPLSYSYVHKEFTGD